MADLSEINPADIVNISILKDISSTAIYGSRGANGVILVTTQDERKSEGTFSVRFKSALSYAQIAGTLDLMNAQEYAMWRNLVASNLSSSSKYEPDKYVNESTDWIEALSQDSFSQDYFLSVYRRWEEPQFLLL